VALQILIICEVLGALRASKVIQFVVSCHVEIKFLFSFKAAIAVVAFEIMDVPVVICELTFVGKK
jgi:hypothetical protein